jgi:hypothetical protein
MGECLHAAGASYYYLAISCRPARIFGCGSAASFNRDLKETPEKVGVLLGDIR